MGAKIKKVLIAPDKFKGSLNAIEVAEAICKGVEGFDSSLDIELLPLADGGEGTCEILTRASHGSFVEVEVHDPLMRQITASYGLSRDRSSAYIEMASASGYELLNQDEANCMLTSSYGTGELILDAVSKGVDHIYLGIGGSATNDAGIGVLAALGYQFLDAFGQELPPIGEKLLEIVSFKNPASDADLSRLSFTLLNDVINVFSGENGAAYVFAPQKGADDVEVKLLDRGLKNFQSIVQQSFSIDLNRVQGAGAGGGIAGGLHAFLGAKLSPGFATISNLLKLDDLISGCDLVVTGEGKVDRQTFQGKVVRGVIEIAKQNAKPSAVLCGINELSGSQAQELGCNYIDSLLARLQDKNLAMKEPQANLSKMATSMMSHFC